MIVLFTLQNLSLQPGAPEENTMSSPHSESPAQSLVDCSASDVTSPTIPSIVISQYNAPLELPEEAEIANFRSSNENSSQDKTEDSDNPLSSQVKMFFKGLGRHKSHESLASSKTGSDEDLSESGLQQERSNKKEKTCFKMSGGLSKTKGKETQATLQGGDDPQALKGQVNREPVEATKAIFDLLKEISGLF